MQKQNLQGKDSSQIDRHNLQNKAIQNNIEYMQGKNIKAYK